MRSLWIVAVVVAGAAVAWWFLDTRSAPLAPPAANEAGATGNAGPERAAATTGREDPPAGRSTVPATDATAMATIRVLEPDGTPNQA